MSEPIRVLHFADVHLGAENYGPADPDSGVNGRVADTLRRLDEMIEFARAADVDLVGLRRRRLPQPQPQSDLSARICRAHVGSCRAWRRWFCSWATWTVRRNPGERRRWRYTLRCACPISGWRRIIRRGLIATKRGDVVLGAAPHLSLGRLLADVDARGLSREEQTAEAELNLRERLSALAAQAESLAKGALPRLLCGHFRVAGAEPGSDADTMPGPEIALTALADGGWDYVALGHQRRHQALSVAAPPVVYSGGLERIGFAEADEAKGFCWVELARGAANWRFVELAARNMLALTVDCRDVGEPDRGCARRVAPPRPGW